jgi:hypothetical protein
MIRISALLFAYSHYFAMLTVHDTGRGIEYSALGEYIPA